MPYGSGQFLRMALIHAKPWQRYLICVVMIGGGIALAMVGHIAGIILSLAGCFMAWKMITYRLRRHRLSASHDHQSSHESPPVGG